MVRSLNKNLDWTFGRGLANYISKDKEIIQKLQTRLKSFKYNWFLNEQDHIDWLNILGKYGNSPVIQSEVERVVIQTEGILTVRVDNSNLNTSSRVLTLDIFVTTIYNNKYNINFQLDI